jgi:hypothetical protein
MNNSVKWSFFISMSYVTIYLISMILVFRGVIAGFYWNKYIFLTNPLIYIISYLASFGPNWQRLGFIAVGAVISFILCFVFSSIMYILWKESRLIFLAAMALYGVLVIVTFL